MKEEKKATRQSYGEELAILGEKNQNIVVLDADLSSATKTDIFAKKFEWIQEERNKSFIKDLCSGCKNLDLTTCNSSDKIVNAEWKWQAMRP